MRQMYVIVDDVKGGTRIKEIQELQLTRPSHVETVCQNFHKCRLNAVVLALGQLKLQHEIRF